MADSAEGDNVLYLGVVALALMSLTAGLVIHSFIIGVNVNDWWKGRSVTPVDHILTSIGISRICAQCAATLCFFVIVFTLENLYSQVTQDIMNQLYCFFAYTNIWFTTLLSIVLCLKISNLHTRLFLYLRRMILERTGYFIVASILLSPLSCLISFIMTELIQGETSNTTMGYFLMGCTNAHYIYIYTIGSLLPVLFCSISSILLFTSLYHHTTRMKMSSNLSINLETYYSLMRFVSFNSLYKTSYFIIDFVCALYYYSYCVSQPWCYIVLETLPLLHSSYLIYRTAKLRNQMSKVLHYVIGFFLIRKNEETQRNIEMIAQ